MLNKEDIINRFMDFSKISSAQSAMVERQKAEILYNQLQNTEQQLIESKNQTELFNNIKEISKY